MHDLTRLRILRRSLPERFGQEIDRVAMREGLTGTDAYLDEWSWSDDRELPGGAAAAADEVVERLVASWDGRS